MAMHLSLVVFDLDGTLTDSVGGIHQALNLMLAEYGCAALSINVVRGMIGDGADRLVSARIDRQQA
jgi:phosphoglycolate phosphatase